MTDQSKYLRKSLLVGIIIGALIISRLVAGHPGVPNNQNTPNGVIGTAGKVDFSELSIALVNDFILIAQIFVTCVPTGALAPVAPNFVRISCMFNLLSALSLLALSILIGWDKIDESRMFKIQIRQAFESWAQTNTRYDLSKRDVSLNTAPFNGTIEQLCRALDLHFDMFVKYSKLHQRADQQRLICAVFEMENSTIFNQKGFYHEICVSKEGIRRLGENRLSKLPLQTVKKLAKFLIYGGFLKAAISPPLFLLNTVQTYGAFAQDVQQRILEMVITMNQETWNGRQLGFTIHEDQKLLLTFTYRVNRLSGTVS